MQITAIVENTSRRAWPVEHGLSLYVQLRNGQRVLFDMGQSALFAQNAERAGLSIAQVDIAVISHGHYDHGGGLRAFLTANQKAKVFVHREAFLPHYSLRDTGLTYIGLEEELKSHPRLTLCEGVTSLGQGLTLFSDVESRCCYPAGNARLFGPAKDECDTFRHEQHLIIQEGDHVALLAGCAHRGIVNILRRAEEIIGRPPTHVIGGMHLAKSGLPEAEEDAFIRTLASQLRQFPDTKFYTMHCTGTEAFHKLQALMGNQIAYLACGETMESRERTSPQPSPQGREIIENSKS